jgi:hypothetical protein
VIKKITPLPTVYIMKEIERALSVTPRSLENLRMKIRKNFPEAFQRGRHPEALKEKNKTSVQPSGINFSR